MDNVLKNNNLPTHSHDEYNYFFKFGITNLVALSLPPNMQDKATISNFQQQVINEYSTNIDLQARAYPGILELLEELTAQNIMMAILSNNDHRYMDDMVQTYFSKTKFIAALGASASQPSKPNPQSALVIADLMDLPPNEIILLGDSPTDIQTALNAEMYPVGAAWGFSNENDLISAGAAKIIYQPIDVLNLFN
jgi:phosphoglycolate phosphatase